MPLLLLCYVTLQLRLKLRLAVLDQREKVLKVVGRRLKIANPHLVGRHLTPVHILRRRVRILRIRRRHLAP